jgi:choline dehydrogenase-like flavoprotein
MKFYMAHDTDTLRVIARKHNLDLNNLILINPHIMNPDSNIAGQPVNLSNSGMSEEVKKNIPVLPFPIIQANITWLPLSSLEQMEKNDYDVLIIGTGAGGGAVLWRLCEQWGKNGKRIGVVEAGDLFLPTHAQNIATLDPERTLMYFDSVAKTDPNYYAPTLNALGGRTLFWSLSSPRMPESELIEWPVPIKAMDFYYKIAEKVMNVTNDFTQNASLTQILLNRLQLNGFPDAEDEPLAIDLRSTSYGVVNSNPFFSSIVFIAQALNRPFDLTVNTRAVEVLMEKGKAVGIKVMSKDKKSYVLKAKTFVLSAGVFGTPQILLNSDIQGRAIGHYLADHSAVIGTASVSRDEFPELLGPLRILIPGSEKRLYQIHILGPGNYRWVQFKVEPLQKESEFAIIALGKIEPRYENQISLDPLKRDDYGVPEIKINFTYSQRDELIIQHMVEGVKQACTAMNVSLISKNGQPVLSRTNNTLGHHILGTCRMGDNPLTSVTNSFGQLHGINNLFVADNSVLPTSGSSGPTLTTVALAIRTADYIVSQLR